MVWIVFVFRGGLSSANLLQQWRTDKGSHSINNLWGWREREEVGESVQGQDERKRCRPGNALKHRLNKYKEKKNSKEKFKRNNTANQQGSKEQDSLISLTAGLIYSVQQPAFVPWSTLLQFTWASFVLHLLITASAFLPHFLLPWFSKKETGGRKDSDENTSWSVWHHAWVHR